MLDQIVQIKHFLRVLFPNTKNIFIASKIDFAHDQGNGKGRKGF